MRPTLRQNPSGLRLLVLGLCLALGSCAVHPKIWVERELPIQNEDVLWQYALAALKAADFPVGLGADPSRRRIESGWHMELQPFRGEGYRERATLEFDTSEEGFMVRSRVEREINMDIVKPLMPTYAKWEGAPDNEARATYLVQLIESRLGKSFELGPTEETKFDDVGSFP